MTRRHQASITLGAVALGMALHAPLALRADSVTSPAVSQVDSYLQPAMQSRKIPGLAVAVVRNGSVVLSRSYGYADVELDAAVAPNSVFEIGSASKQFTAAAVMLLVERGRIQLDDPLRTIMPELSEIWSPVSVRHLLTHTSGIPDYTDAPGFWDARGSTISRTAVLASVAGQPLRFQPGEKWAASATDYFILGLLIERVSGTTYTRFLTEQLFHPLGMGSTRVNDYTRIIKRRVSGYIPGQNGALMHPFSAHPSRLFASGAMVSSVDDLARWQAALLSGRLLKPATVAQMWTPAKLKDGTVTNYGFGAAIRSVPGGGTIIEQTGASAGYRAHIVHFPADNTSVILLANFDTNDTYIMADGVHLLVAANTAIVR